MKKSAVDEITSVLKSGGVVVTKTDTIYGILGLASNKDVVERIYDIKTRDENKPFIILISKVEDLEDFGVILNKESKQLAQEKWPGKVTMIFNLDDSVKEKLAYLHRDSGSLAFRFPDDEFLLNVIRDSGPVVAPSANPQGQEPAKNIEIAEKYFDQKIDLYFDRGEVVDNTPSEILKIENDGSVVKLR